MPSSRVAAAPEAEAKQLAELDHIDLSVKEYSNKELPFGVLIDVSGRNPVTTKIVYDKGYRGRLCFISCHFYDGYTSKWTDYLLSLQPYQTTCFAAAGGCNTTSYPKPDRTIQLIVGEKSYDISMADSNTYSYYLPLEARKALASAGNSRVVIKTSWDILKEYEIGGKTRTLLASVLNTDSDVAIDKFGFEPPQDSAEVTPSIEDRLKEIEALFSKGMVSKDEYEAMRKKVLGLE